MHSWWLFLAARCKALRPKWVREQKLEKRYHTEDNSEEIKHLSESLTLPCWRVRPPIPEPKEREHSSLVQTHRPHLHLFWGARKPWAQNLYVIAFHCQQPRQASCVHSNPTRLGALGPRNPPKAVARQQRTHQSSTPQSPHCVSGCPGPQMDLRLG